MLLILVVFVASLSVGACVYIQHPKFGKLPEGDRLEIIKKSPNYADGEFRNLLATPMFADDSTFLSVLVSNLLSRPERLQPNGPLPSVKTDLKTLDGDRDTVVWLGHSSYFVQLGGNRILVDPVFSAVAAPVSFSTRAFEGTGVYTAEDMPEIDHLLITHDHWDHLDYPSVTALEPKVRKVIAGLGVGAYFEHWGYAKEKIREADWFTVLELERGFTIHVLPARHYSRRLLTKNKTLWTGFALETAGRRIFFSGDSGYGPHFPEIGGNFDGFDLVVLDMGQYDERWPYLHMTPEEAAQAAEALRAKALLPAHVGRFSIARHSWDEPFKRIAAASEGKQYRLLTPRIGEPVYLEDGNQRFSRWWESVE
jgi:L-ascorbate metabolism protein UlaG (beta-lactamase superfamily)